MIKMRFRYTLGKNGKPVKKALVYTQDEHHIVQADIDTEALSILERLRANNFESYLVGGAVRDLILGKKPKDFDIATEASPNEIKRIFRNSRIIGKRFRLAHVFFGDKIYEVSTFRSLKDGSSGNTYGTIEEDVLRRDFTLNALFYDSRDELVIDYVGGMKDMKEKFIKPIIPLKVIFTDDPVRMVRCLKYAATSGFAIPSALKARIKTDANLLANVSPSRRTEEMMKIIKNPAAPEIVQLIFQYGLYGYLQNDAARLMQRSSAFYEAYLASLGQCASGKVCMLEPLISDYLIEENRKGAFPQSNSAEENWSKAFKLARAFILPMNPPRVELEKALTSIMHGMGISSKKPTRRRHR
ncbi:MAG: polynucleotide adenylyltransferase PcnB [Spirochaetaceae bacterium]|jgi:poly(A) polymerase|nr:polynucleotide adenylyltransferase PcnB [Spirochaetaceae bacterium]